VAAVGSAEVKYASGGGVVVIDALVATDGGPAAAVLRQGGRGGCAVGHGGVRRLHVRRGVGAEEAFATCGKLEGVLLNICGPPGVIDHLYGLPIDNPEVHRAGESVVQRP